MEIHCESSAGACTVPPGVGEGERERLPVGCGLYLRNGDDNLLLSRLLLPSCDELGEINHSKRAINRRKYLSRNICHPCSTATAKAYNE
jgi:hypothetical protein